MSLACLASSTGSIAPDSFHHGFHLWNMKLRAAQLRKGFRLLLHGTGSTL